MNPISEKIQIGTLGELLVQIRLLQFGVQTAMPIKDSGNDLIAVNGREFRAVSVRTTTKGRYRKPETDRAYDVLAVVHMAGEGREMFLDQSEIFLIPHSAVARAPLMCSKLREFAWSPDAIEQLFGRLRTRVLPRRLSEYGWANILDVDECGLPGNLYQRDC